MSESAFDRFDPAGITRPAPSLLTYYMLVALFTVVGFPFVFLPLFCKYMTLRYRFDDKGVSMSWGVLFRQEIYLTYRRIQDIHVTRNLLHRWLGLSEVAVQTASGSAGAEMNIEGILQPERLRNFLYQQMRGARDETEPSDTPATAGSDAPADEAVTILKEIRQDLQAVRRHLEQRS